MKRGRVVDWWMWLGVLFGSLTILLLLGVRIGFALLAISSIGMYYIFGGGLGLEQLIANSFSSLATFNFLPLPLFILMGELLFRSGLAGQVLDSVDKLIGRVPGRLSLLAVLSGTLLAVISGSSIATTTLLGSTLLPQMEARGYKKPMTIGPLLASGTLAAMIPPTAMGVTLGAIAQIPIGPLLIAIVVPGLLMAGLFTAYILLRAILQPEMAPSYPVAPTPLRERIGLLVKDVLPLGMLVFLVTGVIFIGVATPSEAAALGILGTLGLLQTKKLLTRSVLKTSTRHAVMLSGTIFLLMAGANLYSQVLAALGATRGLVDFVAQLQISPIGVLLGMQLVILFLGTLMDPTSIMFITIPFFMPIIHHFGLDPIWFAVIVLINLEVATVSPPFGLVLFALKAVAGSGTSIGDIYRSSLPVVLLILAAMAIVIAFPSVALFLPQLMR